MGFSCSLPFACFLSIFRLFIFMTFKHWALVGGAVACFSSPHLWAAPWLEPGDSRARFAAQKLADRGHMDRTVSTWPLMWSSVHSGLQPSVSADHSPVGSAAAYLRFEQEQQAHPGFRGEYSPRLRP